MALLHLLLSQRSLWRSPVEPKAIGLATLAMVPVNRSWSGVNPLSKGEPPLPWPAVVIALKGKTHRARRLKADSLQTRSLQVDDNRFMGSREAKARTCRPVKLGRQTRTDAETH
jgi:hypothetical protein